MAVNKKRSTRKLRPATTDEGREGQLISLASDLAEQQLRDGTASSQVITHLLRAGSTRDNLEKERIKNDNLLLSAKVDAMASAKRVEELYDEALKAMRTYTGEGPSDEEVEDESYY